MDGWKLIIATWSGLALCSAAYADRRYAHYDVDRTVHDGKMTITFDHPMYGTQEIYCPGHIINASIISGLLYETTITKGDTEYYWQRGTRGRPLKRTHNGVRQDPNYLYIGTTKTAEGAKISITCGPVPRKPDIAVSERFITTRISTGQGPCQPEYSEPNIVIYSCGYGYMPPYGCVTENGSRVCHYPSSAFSENWEDIDKALPGTTDLFHEGPPGEHRELARRFALLNETAAKGDPFFKQRAQVVLQQSPRPVEAARPIPTTSSRQTRRSMNYQPLLGGIMLLLGLAGVVLLPKE